MRKRDRRPIRFRSLIVQPLEDRRLLAGPYAPAVGEIGSTAISSDEPEIVAWASGVAQYVPGTSVDAEFQTPEKAIGSVDGSNDVVALGRGGSITLTFPSPIRDGLGFDFAVFENAFSDTFLELGYVEVSSNGIDFFRFSSDSLTPGPVAPFGSVDPRDIDQLAGKYRNGFGTPFDLESLQGIDSRLDTTRVTHVRIIDIVGDGSQSDSSGDAIYDPFPTVGSAGFDLDGVAVLRQSESVREVIGFEDVGGETLSAGSAFSGPDPNGTTIDGAFGEEAVVGGFQSGSLGFNNAHSIDFGSWNQWAYANGTDTTTPGFANQFSAFAGGGANGSATFGIGFPDQNQFYDPPTISRDPGDSRPFESLMVTTTTYAALSMRDGDSFAKQFGGASGNDPDFLRLTITGRDSSGSTVDSIEFYLADYRFTDNDLDSIVDHWVEIDLSPIANADSIAFAIESSDVGDFGVNTPAYFAVDDITFAQPVLPIDIGDRRVSEADGAAATVVRISRPDDDTSTSVDISISPVDSTIAVVPTSVTIASGERYVEFPVEVIDNELFHGDRVITIAAATTQWLGSQRELTIEDDEVRELSLAVDRSSLREGETLLATVTRNDADVSNPLTIDLTESDPTLVGLPDTVTIEAGQRSVGFAVVGLEDTLSRIATEQSITASAPLYRAATKSFEVLDNDTAAIRIESTVTVFDESESRPTTRFEDVGRRLLSESFYNGSDGAAGFVSDGVAFNNQYDADFFSWSGWSYSNTTDTTTAGFGNQYSAITGGGSRGSDTYAVASTYVTPTITRDPSTTGDFQSIDITNTTYATLSMREGDNFAKKFGGVTGDDPDFFLLTIEGRDPSGTTVGTVEFYLADFRFADNGLDSILDQWKTVDVSSLGGAVELAFSLSSSDVGVFGMNTPAYFAADNITFASSNSAPNVTVTRNTFDVSGDLVVTLASSDLTEVDVPSTVTIPSGLSSVAVPLTVFDDSLVDGNQNATITGTAPGYNSANRFFTVTDDDQPRLSLAILTPSISESAGEGRAVLYRNLQDTSQSTTVSLAANFSEQLVLPEIIEIPLGQRSVEVSFQTEDNQIVDGDRIVSITATAAGMAAASGEVRIEDEDVPPPSLTLTIDETVKSESDAAPTVMFEDLGSRLADETFANGDDLEGGFSSGLVRLNNSYDTTFGSWGGWSISNTTDSTTPGFANQYSAVSGGGAGDSATYAVASAYPGGVIPAISLDPAAVEMGFESIMVTNTTYAALSMRHGDAFAKKFGGDTGTDPDFFLLQIEGRDENDQSVGVIDFYLADFRFDDKTQDSIVDQWTRVDVSSLVGATKLEFSMSSSDVGSFGMNTPAYFAVDNVVLNASDVASQNTSSRITATVTRNYSNLDAPLIVKLSTNDSSEVMLPDSVVIPAGFDAVNFPISVLDDAVADGTQTVTLSALSDLHPPAEVSIAIEDNEQAKLTLSTAQSEFDEDGGQAATRLLVHRNTENNSAATAITVMGPGVDLMFSAELDIPAGKRTQWVSIDAVDNSVREGDRSHLIAVSATGFAASETTLIVQDNEISGWLIQATGETTIVGEFEGEDQFAVSLLSQPLTDVSLDLHFDATSIGITPSRLIFTPNSWNMPQFVTVYGVPDLRIDSEIATAVVRVDAAASAELYRNVQETAVEIIVEDYQPAELRLSEDGSSIFLQDTATGVRILHAAHSEGIHVLANELSQMILVDSFTLSSGIIDVDASAGDDQVSIRGTRFDSINGGDGYDRFVLQLDSPVDLIDLLEGRVSGMEEYVIANHGGAKVTIDVNRFDKIVPQDSMVTLRILKDQVVTLIGDPVSEPPLMIGSEFAQIVSAADRQVAVISDKPWQNVVNRWDVNRSGDVTSVDALVLINQLARITDSSLPAIEQLSQFTGHFYDVTGDGLMTASDPLHVINALARSSAESEAPVALVRSAAGVESIDPPVGQTSMETAVAPRKVVSTESAVDAVMAQVYANSQELVEDAAEDLDRIEVGLRFKMLPRTNQ